MRDANTDPVKDPTDEELLDPMKAKPWFEIARMYGLQEWRALLKRTAKLHADAETVGNQLPQS